MRIQEGRDLNLTKISLEYSLPCERPGDIEDIEWYSIDGGSDGGSKFALCTSYQKCHIKEEHPVPPFWNRLRVITGSLFLTGIQSDDNKLKIGLKIFSKSCKTNMVEERVYIIWILVMSEQDSPGN